MKSAITIALIAGAASSCFFVPQPVFAQQCKDEEALVVDYKKGLTELVDTTRKETQANFEKAFHQKTGLTKLGLCSMMVDELVSCLDKASADSTATKDQVEAIKAKREAYSKLKEKLEENRKSLKAKEDSKAAKALMEKLEYSN